MKESHISAVNNVIGRNRNDGKLQRYTSGSISRTRLSHGVAWGWRLVSISHCELTVWRAMWVGTFASMPCACLGTSLTISHYPLTGNRFCKWLFPASGTWREGLHLRISIYYIRHWTTSPCENENSPYRNYSTSYSIVTCTYTQL